MMKFLDGRKTYIGMVALGVLELIAQMVDLSPEMLTMGRTVIGTFLGVSVKHSWDKKNK